MKKEAINTFGEGMIMDLHPLTTPNNVLTNCLNGTMVTYNGNEFVLQNDIGNGEVHTAFLDKGYVPVGMKEHGGIIYVAAHNPITGKSQIGSFPSPQQLYEGDDLNVTGINFNFSNFITVTNDIPFINTEYFKLRLFQEKDSNTEKVKIFHPGDKFLIASNKLSQNLKLAINDGVVKLRLGVINNSGNIDYIDDSNLKIYSNGLWIYENENPNIHIGDLLKDKEKIQVFSAKSSGALVLIIELKTFKTFNLLRKYSADNNNKIKVQLIGDMNGIFKGKTDTNTDEVALYSNNIVTDVVTISGTEGQSSYTVSPVCPYGVLKRMTKLGIIDFDAIRSNSESLNEWRFFVTETYLKIGWGYDYYNMNENSDINKIDFVFIDINSASTLTTEEGINTMLGTYTYTISKDYFNGSFEEIIPFEDSTIQKNWVYIVRLDRYVENKKEVIGYRIVYTGGYFNQFYETVQDFTKGTDLNNNSIISHDSNSRDRIEIKVETKIDSSIDKDDPTYTLKLKESEEHTETNNIMISQYVSELNSAETDISKYKYETCKIGHYNVKIKPSATYEYNRKMYAGSPDNTVIDEYFGSNPKISVNFDESGITTNNNSLLNAHISKPSSISTDFKFNSDKTITGKLSTSRYIYANPGTIANKKVLAEMLDLVYNPQTDANRLRLLFAFQDDGALRCTFGDEKRISFGGILQYGGKRTLDGTDAGGGHDEDGLQAALISMGGGTIGIMGGMNGDDASLRYEGVTRHDINGWHCGDHHREVDNKDNFLITAWKDTTGKYHLVNLFSRQNEEHSILSQGTIIRLEMMLRCLLSQLLVAQVKSRDIFYVGPNPDNYLYHTASNTIANINVETPNANTDIPVNFYLGGEKSIEDNIKTFLKILGNKLVNFLPIFYTHKDNNIKLKLEFGNDIDFTKDSNILNCYTNAYSAVTVTKDLLNGNDRGTIYLADTSVGCEINDDGSVHLNSIKPLPLSSNTIIDWRKLSWTFNNNFNDIFTTAYKRNHMTGLIKLEDFYNEILINKYSNRIGQWTQNAKGGAPDLAIDVLESNKSLFT